MATTVGQSHPGRDEWLLKYDEQFAALVAEHGEPVPLTAADIDRAVDLVLSLGPPPESKPQCVQFGMKLRRCKWDFAPDGDPELDAFLVVDVCADTSRGGIRRALLVSLLGFRDAWRDWPHSSPSTEVVAWSDYSHHAMALADDVEIPV